MGGSAIIRHSDGLDLHLLLQVDAIILCFPALMFVSDTSITTSFNVYVFKWLLPLILCTH